MSLFFYDYYFFTLFKRLDVFFFFFSCALGLVPFVSEFKLFLPVFTLFQVMVTHSQITRTRSVHK